MPDIETHKYSNKIQSVEKISLENGWEQWLLKSEIPLQINPSSNLVLEQFSLPVLWQIDAHQFICIKSDQQLFKQEKQWNNFSITNNNITNTSLNIDADYCLMICPGNTLFYAIHQIQQWRTNNQIPKNLIVIAEAISNAAFKLQPSRIYSSLTPSSATASIALLDDWGVLCRFTNTDWQPGCYQGELKQFSEKIELNLKNKSAFKICF